MTVGRWPLTARSGLSPFAGGCHSEGRLNLKAAGWPTEVPRPLLTMGVSPDSGSNVPVTCRSTRSHVERQLLHPTSSHNRPNPASRISPNRAARQIHNLPTGMLQCGHWRPHPIGQKL